MTTNLWIFFCSRGVGLPEKQNQNWFRRMKSVRSDLDDTVNFIFITVVSLGIFFTHKYIRIDICVFLSFSAYRLFHEVVEKEN